MAFHEVRDWSELQTGSLGIAQPQPRQGAPACKPDVVIVPGVAFSRHLHRLGLGGGYYDRAIHAWEAAGAVPRLIALSYDFQLVDELPCENHDRAMDVVVLESRILRREG
jgi:5-formyltetrahydrofolate cyclo-ligase